MLNAQNKRVNSLGSPLFTDTSVPAMCAACCEQGSVVLFSLSCASQPGWCAHTLSVHHHVPVLCVDWLCLLKHLSPGFSSRLLSSVLQAGWQLYILEVRATHPTIRKQSK